LLKQVEIIEIDIVLTVVEHLWDIFGTS